LKEKIREKFSTSPKSQEKKKCEGNTLNTKRKKGIRGKETGTKFNAALAGKEGVNVNKTTGPTQLRRGGDQTKKARRWPRRKDGKGADKGKDVPVERVYVN